jgi:AcrR family transcriptional regulator
MTRAEPATTPASRRRRTREETRHQIVDAAFLLFSQNGFSRTSVRDIAAAVGVTDAALYHYFDSKKELLDAVFEERGTRGWMEWIEKIRGTASLSVVLERTSVAALQFIEQNRDLLRLVLLESLAGDANAIAHHAGMMSRWRRGIRLLVGDRVGSRDDEATALIAEHLVAALWGVAVERLLGTDSEPLLDGQGQPAPRMRALVRQIVTPPAAGLER